MMSLMHATVTLMTAIYGMLRVKSHTNKIIKKSKNNFYVKKYLVVKQINLECLLPTKLGINHNEYLAETDIALLQLFPHNPDYDFECA